MKLKHLFALIAFALAGNASAKEDVTYLLNDPALEDESANWSLYSSSYGGTHSAALNGYHESRNYPFTLNQIVEGLPAGYYRLSIQAAANGIYYPNPSSYIPHLQEYTHDTSGQTGNAVSAAPVYTTASTFEDMASWWAADERATGNANLNRIYTTVKVEEGENLHCFFGYYYDNAVSIWMVYGQFRLERLTDTEGKNAQKFEAWYNKQNKMQDMARGRYKQRFEDYTAGEVAANSEKLVYTYTGLPNGKYNVTINGSASYTSGRGFDGASGDNLTVFFANDKTTNVPVVDRLDVGDEEFEDYTVENVVVNDGTLRVGYRNLAVGANWFTGSIKSIEFLGTDLSDLEPSFKEAKTKALDVDQNKAMNATVKSDLQAAISEYCVEFSSYTDVEELETAISTLTNVANKANSSIKKYEELYEVITSQAEIVAKYDDAGQAAYELAAAPALSAYDDGAIDNTPISLDKNYYILKKALQTAVRAQGVGGNYTAALENPDFKTNDLNGWDRHGKANPTVDVANHNCEFYEKTFDMSQTVTDLKKGTYEISFQAFQRPGAAGDDLATNFVNGNWTSCATLYTTAQETAVKHICEDWQDEAQSDVDDWSADYLVTPSGGTGHYIPNGMKGGRQWFDKGYYVTTAKAVVLEDGGSLTFGFRGQQPSGSWILFDNFTLRYISEDVLVDEAESDKIIASVETIEYQEVTASVKEALINAKNELASDKTNGTKYNALKSAIADFQAYVALKEALENEIFAEKNISYWKFTYKQEAQAMYEAGTAAATEVQAKADGMLNAYRYYIRHNVNHPIVLAVKGVRESSAWEYTTEPTNNQSLNNPKNDDVEKNSLWENWKAGGLTEGDMKQIVKVPIINGKVYLSMASFTRNSINENDYIYIKSGENIAKAVSLGDASTYNAYLNITDAIEVVDGQVEIGLHVGSGADWAAIGNVGIHVSEIDDYTRDTPTGGYGTICLPYNVSASGATFFTNFNISDYDGKINLDSQGGSFLRAGIPYIYRATADKQTFRYNFDPIVNDTQSVVDDFNGYYLTGAFTLTEVPANDGNYMLQCHDGKYGFYFVDKDAHIGAYRCYVKAIADSPSTGIKAFIFDDKSTSMEDIGIADENNAIYDLMGRKVEKAGKGIYIINGKKVLK